MTIITGLWALFALACCVVGYFIYRDETQARQAQYVSHLDQRHAARKRQAQYELTFWKLFGAAVLVAGIAVLPRLPSRSPLGGRLTNFIRDSPPR